MAPSGREGQEILQLKTAFNDTVCSIEIIHLLKPSSSAPVGGVHTINAESLPQRSDSSRWVHSLSVAAFPVSSLGQLYTYSVFR